MSRHRVAISCARQQAAAMKGASKLRPAQLQFAHPKTAENTSPYFSLPNLVILPANI